MRKGFVAAVLLVAVVIFAGTASADSRVEKRIDRLVSKMTLEEKIGMLGGINVFDTRPIPRLGIPSIKMTDGPLGVRDGKKTAFPSGIALGASFDPGLLHDVAVAIADEARSIGKNMLLGPCVNIARNPFGGRNFESFGEDPHSSGQLAASYVKGIQSRNVLASVKHFALNDQEHERMTIDVRADARTMFEIHLPAFKSAVDAGSWTVMAAYNKINGHHGTENDFLLNKVLKGMWGFKGFVVSDWDATHSAVEAANHGLDLEMPWGLNFGEPLLAAVREGKVKESVIDDKIRRLLRAMFAIGLIDPQNVRAAPAPKGPEAREHRMLALKASRESIVLLKNEDAILPLAGAGQKIALIGPNAATARAGGGGSSQVEPYVVVSPLDGFKARLGRSAAKNLSHAQGGVLPGYGTDPIPALYLKAAGTGEPGLRGEYFSNKGLTGRPLFTRVDKGVSIDIESVKDPRLTENFSVRWTGTLHPRVTGRYKLSTISDDGVRLFIDGKEVISHWQDHGRALDTAEVELVAGQSYDIRLEYYQAGGWGVITLGWEPPLAAMIAEAAEVARQADVAVVFAGLGNGMESEAGDRTTIELPPGQNELIKAVVAANPNTVVVLTSGNPLAMSQWLGKVKAVVQMWYPGQEGGTAIADVLLGKVNPSGKLPITLIKRWEDSSAYGHYPGENGRVEYAEGVFVGYRHMDAKRLQPEFPFGFGLSYTKFDMKEVNVRVLSSKPGLPRVRIEMKIQNIGDRDGAEVAQVYVGEVSPALPRPVRELKGFKKVFVRAGETKSVAIELDAAAFSYFDEASMSWKTSAGEFKIAVGTSSRDLRAEKTIRLD